MKVSTTNIAKAIFELAQKNPKGIPELIRQFYFYLLKERKIKMLPTVLEKLKEIERKRMKIKEIEVETASSLSFGQKEKIKKIFKKQKVVLKEKINPDLLGGLILRTDETIVDGSLKNNLERLKEELWQTPIK